MLCKYDQTAFLDRLQSSKEIEKELDAPLATILGAAKLLSMITSGERFELTIPEILEIDDEIISFINQHMVDFDNLSKPNENLFHILKTGTHAQDMLSSIESLVVAKAEDFF